MWRTDGTAHPYQLKDTLYVPDLKYSLLGERELYQNGFGRQNFMVLSKYLSLECMRNLHEQLDGLF